MVIYDEKQRLFLSYLVAMSLNGDILEFLFATAATIVATLTGLIGAFSTFRLQTVGSEIALLKNLLLTKSVDDQQTIRSLFKDESYALIEKVYDLDLAGVGLLEELIHTDERLTAMPELLVDLDNIRRNQLLYDAIKKLTLSGFGQSLVFVMVSLLLLLLTNALLEQGRYVWPILGLYMGVLGYLFIRFMQQLRVMVSVS